MPAWGLWGDESPQQPKRQNSLARGHWLGGPLGPHCRAILRLLLIGKIQLHHPGKDISSVMGGLRTQLGDKELQGKLQRVRLHGEMGREGAAVLHPGHATTSSHSPLLTSAATVAARLFLWEKSRQWCPGLCVSTCCCLLYVWL